MFDPNWQAERYREYCRTKSSRSPYKSFAEYLSFCHNGSVTVPASISPKPSFPIQAAIKQKTDAIQKTYSNADPEWIKSVLNLIRDMCRNRPDFIADDVWFEMQSRGVMAPEEPRALGAVFAIAKKQKMIRASDRFKASSRRHATPMRVWESLIFSHDTQSTTICGN